MKTIVFASSKGGVGKTTLAFNTAIQVAKTSGVQMIDRDPQRSLMDLCLRRREMPQLIDDNPMILENVDTVGNAVSRLQEAGYDRDYLIVDTPGSFMEVIEEAISVADVVVLPLKPSPLDVVAQETVIDIVRHHHKIDHALFVLNMVDARSPLTSEAIKAVKAWTDNPAVTVGNRVDYARAPITAQAAVEVNKTASNEITKLWNAVEQIIGNNTDGKTSPRKPRRSR